MIVATYPLVSGQLDYTIAFPAVQTAVPDVVIPVVLNNTADVPKLLINAYPKTVSNSGFTVRLDAAPNTNNYVLSYMAGSAQEFFQQIQFYGRLFSQVPNRSSAPTNNDRMLMMAMAPLPHSEQITFENFASALALYQATVPAAVNAAGRAGTLSFDANYLYFRTGTGWNRIPMIPDPNWGASYKHRQVREARVALIVDEQIQTFTYAPAFAAPAAAPNEVPDVRAQVLNYTNAGAKSVIGAATIIGSTLTDFTVLLSAPPETSDYKLYYEAKLDL